MVGNTRAGQLDTGQQWARRRPGFHPAPVSSMKSQWTPFHLCSSTTNRKPVPALAMVLRLQPKPALTVNLRERPGRLDRAYSRYQREQGAIPRDSQRSNGSDPAARGHNGRSQVHGFSRGLATFLDTSRRTDRGYLRGGHRVRWFQRCGLACHQRGRSVGRSPARNGTRRPVHGAADVDDDLQYPLSPSPTRIIRETPGTLCKGRQ